MDAKSNGSRSAVATANRIGENHLRYLEGKRILPTWAAVQADEYQAVLTLWLAARSQLRWSSQKIEATFEVIRRARSMDELIERAEESLELSRDYLEGELARIKAKIARGER